MNNEEQGDRLPGKEDPLACHRLREGPSSPSTASPNDGAAAPVRSAADPVEKTPQAAGHTGQATGEWNEAGDGASGVSPAQQTVKGATGRPGENTRAAPPGETAPLNVAELPEAFPGFSACAATDSGRTTPVFPAQDPAEPSAEPLPREIVETYEPGTPREIVETYVRSLPQSRTPKRLEQKRRKNSRWGLWIFLICVAVLTGVILAARLIAYRQAIRMPSTTENRVIESSQGVSIPVHHPEEGVALTPRTAHGEALTAQEIYRRLNPTVVTVIVQVKGGVSVGTGVLFSSDGYLLTNYHVVDGGTDCIVTLDSGRTLETKFVAGDGDNDIAILKAEGVDLPAAEFGSSDDLTVGDKVYAIGNPLGVKLRGTLTDGIVSAINRDVSVDGRTMTLIQTNAALNSGNSGGPLINQYGQVVGINTIKMSSNYSTVEGLGFALPASSLAPLVNDLLTYGQIQPQPQLGVSVSQTSTLLPDGTQGIEVVSVTAGSAADQAGIVEGDVVVLADGEEILSSQDLLQVRRRFHIGDEMTMRVYREGLYLDFTLHLTKAAE